MQLKPYIILTKEDERLGVFAVGAVDAEHAVMAFAQHMQEQNEDKFIIGALSGEEVGMLQNAIDEAQRTIDEQASND